MLPEPHRALRLRDIQDLICAHVDNADLARLARTSHSWFLPAISRLWRRRDRTNFLELLGLIPGATRKEGASRSLNKQLPNDFAMPMFDRLSLYAPWTTSVYVTLEDLSRGPPSSEQVDALHATLRFMSGRIMFPRLQGLSISSQSYNVPPLAGATWLFLLVSPSITRFELTQYHVMDRPEIPIHDRIIEVFSGIVVNTCSELKELALDFSPRALSDMERESPANLPCIPPQPHLSVLHLPSHLLDKTWFRWISQLPQLQRLEIDGKLTSTHVRENLGSHLAPKAFPVLSDIHLCDVTFDLFVALWQPAVVHQLTGTTLFWLEPTISSQDALAVVNMIATHTPNLTSLALDLCLSNGHGSLPLRILGSLPLVCLDLDNLRYHELDLPEDIETFGIFWPKLEELSLGSIAISYPELLKISIVLPNLRKLGIYLPEDPPDIEIDIPSHPLTNQWPRHKLCLTPWRVACDGWGFETDELESLGLLLAMAWPNMILDIDDPDNTCQRELVVIRKALERHSVRILNSG